MDLAKEVSPVSRRSFMRMASVAAASMPILTEAHFALAAQQTAPKAGSMAAAAQTGATTRRARTAMPPGAVLINANENPLGPCRAACEAIASIAPKGGRYDIDGETDKLTKTLSTQLGVPEDHISIYAGSSEPLHYTVLAFTSPDRGLVVPDPTFEAAERGAKVTGAKVSKIPLTATYAHDVKALVAANPNAGLIYICNPNNPTGTLTPREDILFALENKPKGSILLVDEAYIHLSDAPTVIDQVAAGKDLIVIRTFSKIYGMAGIRCGYAVGRPDLLAKLQPYGQNAMPITGSIAANVSLLDPQLIPTRKKIIGDIRTETIAWLQQNNYKVLPGSQSNCFMIDTGRNGRQFMKDMQARNVYIGRTWAIWPNTVRITVGTANEMAQFRTAFKETMDAGPTTASLHSSIVEPAYLS